MKNIPHDKYVVDPLIVNFVKNLEKVIRTMKVRPEYFLNRDINTLKKPKRKGGG